MDSFRKAYGALKDSTTVGLANLNSDFKELDIAIVKATNHDDIPPKERHVMKILTSVSINRSRADVAYCIRALSRRLSKTRNWIVALKTLIVVHRSLREAGTPFKEELLQYSRRGRLFQISNFRDQSSPLAWDCSSWLRAYALYLEERCECFRTMRYDIEADRASRFTRGMSKAQKKTLFLNDQELLQHLPSLQQLLHRLICCQPQGAACHNYLIQYSLALVLKESFKIYCSINDGIINLVDMFFEMPKHDAVKALNIYKNAGKQAVHLADFYGFCRTLALARTFHFPTLRQPPPTFLATMEEYVKEAPQTDTLLNNTLEYRETGPETESEPEKQDEPSPEETEKQVEEPAIEEVLPSALVDEPIDLLGLNEMHPRALEIEESNALALAILQPGSEYVPSNALVEIGKTSGWELALVTTPSNTSQPNQVAQAQMAGGFDKLLLDSLYEDEARRRTLQLHSAGHDTSYGYDMVVHNPFNQQIVDPFAMSNNIAPPRHVQMAMMSQQEQMMYQQQQMEMVYGSPYSAQQMPGFGSPNPFGDPFSYPQSAFPPSQGSNHLI